MKLALTVWNGRISPVFDVCREALVVDIERGVVVSSSVHGLEGGTDFDRVGRLSGMGVETLICGAISRPLHRELLARHVEVIGFVAGDVGAVLAAFLTGRLGGNDFAMPGCGRCRRRMRGAPVAAPEAVARAFLDGTLRPGANICDHQSRPGGLDFERCLEQKDPSWTTRPAARPRRKRHCSLLGVKALRAISSVG